MEEYIKFKSYIDKIKVYNSSLKTDIENMNKTNTSDIKEISDKYNKISEEIKEYIIELDKLIETYGKKNKEYIESMKTSQTSIDAVATFDPTDSKERAENFYTEDLTNVNNSLFSNPELKDEVSVKIKQFFEPFCNF
jgi:hypothetical protein